MYSEERNWEGKELETQGWVEKLHRSDSALAPLMLSLCVSPVTGNSPCRVRQHVVWVGEDREERQGGGSETLCLLKSCGLLLLKPSLKGRYQYSS